MLFTVKCLFMYGIRLNLAFLIYLLRKTSHTRECWNDCQHFSKAEESHGKILCQCNTVQKQNIFVKIIVCVNSFSRLFLRLHIVKGTTLLFTLSFKIQLVKALAVK